MQTTKTKPQDTVRCKADISHLWITVRQRDLIRTTWPRIVTCDSDFEQVGVDVFLRIFSRHPELILLFPFRDVVLLDNNAEMTAERLTATLDVVRQHPTFRNHAMAFASAIGMAVDVLGLG